MSEREFHPVANLFPLLEGAEFQDLCRDIEDNGLLVPIWLHPDGRIIDGRNRYRACLDTMIEPEFRTWSGDGSLVAFALSMNLARRHLSASQKGMVAADSIQLYTDEAKARMMAGKKQDDPMIILSQGTARKQAAKAVGASEKYTQDSIKLKAEAPELAAKVRSGELTIPQAKREVKRAERVEVIQEISAKSEELETGVKYPVIYCDPPWRYDHSKSDTRKIENHYPTMSIDEICSLHVEELSTPDAVLFMWATNPKLREALAAVSAWGFTYKTNMCWDKGKIGMGYYARQQHELLLIATRGAPPTPEPKNRPPSVIRAKRSEHSKKPAEVYSIIEAMYPEYKKIELFSRNRREGWAAWGNQA